MSSTVADSDEAIAEATTDPIIELRQMLSQVPVATQRQGEQMRNDIKQMKRIQAHQRDDVADLKTSIIQLSTTDTPDTTRVKANHPRKSSIFFGAPDASSQNFIQVLHIDIVDDKELKVSSL
jgi:hypothetical protein